MIYFQSISEHVDSENYLNHRLEKLLNALPQEQRDQVLRGLAGTGAGAVLPHFVPAGELQGAAEAASEARKAAEEHFPLTSGEQVQAEELCAVLVGRASMEGTPLFLRQTTNFAQSFVQVPGRVVKDGAIVDASELQLPPQAEAPVAVVPAWALALAKTLGQKLLQHLGTAVWDVVRKEVLHQTDLPTYYEQVYAEIRQIIASAFQEHYIKEVKDLAARFEHAMSYYNNMGRKEIDFLTVKDTSFDLITKSNSLGLPGTFHYAEASVLHVMTLQEGYRRLAEEHGTPDQLEKAKRYISEMARQFADNIVAKHGLLLVARMATISSAPYPNTSFLSAPDNVRTIGGVREGVYGEDGRFSYACAPIQNMFRDDTNGFFNAMYFHLIVEAFDPGHSWRWVDGHLQQYRQAIHDLTLVELRPLLDVAERLRELADKPVLEAAGEAAREEGERLLARA